MEDAHAPLGRDPQEFIKGDKMGLERLALIGFCIILLCSCAKEIRAQDPFPGIVLPVYQGAIDAKNVLNQPKGTKAVVYRIHQIYPAQELISFYEKYFTARGFIRYSEDDEGKCVWTIFNQKIGQWEPYSMQSGDATPQRFICSWVDRNHETRILLILRDNDTDNLDVTCQVYPFFDHREVIEGKGQ